MPDIFISYAREDKTFVEQLVKALAADGRDVWVDFEDIPFASDWWEEIQTGIDASDAAVFVISPDSITSRYCSLEINYAIKNNKRLIPVVFREPGEAQPPKEVAALNWIFFKEAAAFDQALKQLLLTVDTDQEMLERHTRLLILARDWEKNGHNRSFLLRGAELSELDTMLTQPNLTDLQRVFLEQSLRQQRRLELYWRFGLGFLGGFLGIGFWAFSQFESDQLITPLRFVYTSSLGQMLGLFIGLLSVLAGALPIRITQQFSPPILFALRVAACFVIGVLAWTIFNWLYREGWVLNTASLNSLLLGGLGLALGFILRILFQLPGWVAALLTAVATFLPMLLTYQWFFAGVGPFDALVYFRNVSNTNMQPVFSAGIPMVLFIALGANAQALAREVWQLIAKVRS
jgi:hypothetical protein